LLVVLILIPIPRGAPQSMKISLATARQSAADLISLFAQGYRPLKRPQGLPGQKQGIIFALGRQSPRATVSFLGTTSCREKNRPAVFRFLSSDRRERAVKNSFFELILRSI
jgi:hypothetical protein